MASYERFAEVYDTLQADVAYANYLAWVQRYAPASDYPTLLDVGCGTGTLCEYFVENGYHTAGVDLSEDMLAIAMSRFMLSQYEVPFFCQSMDELEGFANLDVIMIALDSLNYLTSEQAIKNTFAQMYKALRPGGQLFFDVHSFAKMAMFLESPFTYDDGDITYIWYTEEGEAPHSIIHDMTFFVANANGTYDRFEETHYQQTFAPARYEQWLSEVGFTEVTIGAEWQSTPLTDESDRVFIRAVK